ncbi:MAG: tetratricopeptide repeat protein, partial [Bacteroidetes bacterium]|nr:tetratricopeptide repeat protein [Bacteroidota bacterium]
MKKTLPLFFIFSFSFFISPAQDYHKIDSLKNVLGTLPTLDGTDADTTRMKLCLNIGDLYLPFRPDSALLWYKTIIDTTSIIENFTQQKQYYNSLALRYIGFVLKKQKKYDSALLYYSKSLETANRIDDRSAQSKCLLNIAGIYSKTGKNDLAIECLHSTLSMAEALSDSNLIIICNAAIGETLQEIGDYQSSVRYFAEAQKYSVLLNNKKYILGSLVGSGLAYYMVNDFPMAEEFLLSAIDLAELLHDVQIRALCEEKIGSVYANQGNFNGAVLHYEKSLQCYKKTGNKKETAYIHIKLGDMHCCTYDFAKAEASFAKAKTIFVNIEDTNGLSDLYSGLGIMYLMKEEYSKSFEAYNKALEIRETQNDLTGLAACYVGISWLFLSQNEYESAEKYLVMAIKIHEDIGSSYILSIFYPQLAKIYILAGRYSEARQILVKSLNSSVEILRQNFRILSENEKEKYLEITRNIFDKIVEFHLFFPQYDSLRGLCYNNELLLKGLILNSSRSMMDIVSNSSDTAIQNSYWLLVQQRKQISEQLSTPKDERTLNVDSLERAANNTEHTLVKLSDVFADNQEQFGYTWQDVQKTLQPGEAAIEFVKIKHTIFRSDTLKIDSCSYAALVLKPGDVVPKFIALCNEESLEKLLTRS